MEGYTQAHLINNLKNFKLNLCCQEHAIFWITIGFILSFKLCYKHQHCECSRKSWKSVSRSVGSLAEVNIRTSEYIPIYLQLFLLLLGFCYFLLYLYDKDGSTNAWILKPLCNHISFWSFSLHVGLITQKDAKSESETTSRELAMESH